MISLLTLIFVGIDGEVRPPTHSPPALLGVLLGVQGHLDDLKRVPDVGNQPTLAPVHDAVRLLEVRRGPLPRFGMDPEDVDPRP